MDVLFLSLESFEFSALLRLLFMSCRKKDYDDHDAEWDSESEKTVIVVIKGEHGTSGSANLSGIFAHFLIMTWDRWR